MWQLVLQISSITPGNWIDNLPTSLTASRRHWSLFCPVQVGFLQNKSDGESTIVLLREAKVTTTRTIPVQVDGEAVRLNPCTIEITHLNKVLTKN